MDQNLPNQAISAAMDRNWKLAVSLNLQILKSEPHDTQALNRLARAYLETGHKVKAQTAYKQVLKIDRYDSIATRGLQQVKNAGSSLATVFASPAALPQFLEEPGITRTVSLSRLGDPKILSALRPADPVLVTARQHCVSVLTPQKQYLGRLPDDLASRMRTLLKAGNVFQAWVKSVELQNSDKTKPGLKIFIREVSRGAKYKDSPSFPPTEKLTYVSFTPPELVHQEKPNISTTGEDTAEVDSPEQID